MPGLYLPWLVCLCTKLQQHLAAKNNLLVLSDSLAGVQAALSAAETEVGSDVAAGSGVTRRLIHSFIHLLSELG